MVMEATAPAAVADPTVAAPPVVQVDPSAISAAVPGPEVTAPVVPVAPAPIPLEVQQYIRSLQEQAASLQSQAAQGQEMRDDRVIGEWVQTYAKQIENEHGLTEEAAQNIAREQGQRALASYRQQQFLKGQTNAAIAIGQQYRVDARALMGLATPNAMKARAQAIRERGSVTAELTRLREEVAMLKKTPSTTYANGVVGGTGERPTKYNIDSLFNQGKVGSDVYRRFLATGEIA